MKIFLLMTLFIFNLVIVVYSQELQSLPCRLFPSNNIWNTPIDHLPVNENSDIYISKIGLNIGLHADFGSGFWNGGPIGIPYNIVSGDQLKVTVEFEYYDESDPGPYPIPDNPKIEGDAEGQGDRHILMLDKDNCILYELYASHKDDEGNWSAGSGAIFDLNSNTLRPDTWTSADAAGLPILPGLVRYDEIMDGEINHAIRFTVPSTHRSYVWPATHYASSISDKAYPPMGLRLRLKKDFDISGFPSETQIILKALKKYGMILADNGSAIFLSGVPDGRWNDDSLGVLRNVKGGDFEVVDASSLMIDKNSGEAKQTTNVDNIQNQEINFNTFYNSLSDEITIKATKTNAFTEINVYDIRGNKLHTIYNSNQNGEIKLKLKPEDIGIKTSNSFVFFVINSMERVGTSKLAIIR